MDAPLHIDGCKLVHLQQRSTEWHAWRNGADLADGKPRITGTVAAIVAGDSVTGKTAHQLWMELSGRKQPEVISDYLRKLFDHGQRTERVAKAAYEAATGNEVFEICVEHPDHPWAAASLDGLTALGDILSEFKAPVSQRIHTMAKRGMVPSYYYPQVQWQLFCTPTALEAHYYSWFEEDEEGIKGALVVVQRDQEYQEQLFRDCLDFRICVVEDRPPANNQWLLAARTYRQAKADLEEATARLESSMKALTDMIPPDRDTFDGGGIMATRYYAKCSVDWKTGFKSSDITEEAIAEAEEACREAGPIDYARVLDTLGIDEERRKVLEEASRTPGAVDYKRAAERLGLTKADIRLLESKYKTGGEVRYRVTVTNDYVPVVTPATPSDAIPGIKPDKKIEIVESREDSAQPALENWSGW